MKHLTKTIIAAMLAILACLPVQAKQQYLELDDGTILAYDDEAENGGIDLSPYVRVKNRDYHWIFNKYWYEDGYRQGIYGDSKNITDKIYGFERGREIYDPASMAWYWLDAIYDGAKAMDKEVWMPYIYQNEPNGSTNGKWVRYNKAGGMIKGWYTVLGHDCDIYPAQAGNTYYYDPVTGAMAKGEIEINGKQYYFHEQDGHLLDESATFYNLAVPFRQQEKGYYCGPAAMQSVLLFHGIQISQDDLAKELNTSPSTGTEYADVARVASKHLFNNPNPGPSDPGYRAVTWKTDQASSKDRELFESRVIRDMKTADPVFIAINLHIVYPSLSQGNDLVVITGCEINKKTGKIVSFTILDPYTYSQPYTDHGKKTVQADMLWQAINHNSEPGYVW